MFPDFISPLYNLQCGVWENFLIKTTQTKSVRKELPGRFVISVKEQLKSVEQVQLRSGLANALQMFVKQIDSWEWIAASEMKKQDRLRTVQRNVWQWTDDWRDRDVLVLWPLWPEVTLTAQGQNDIGLLNPFPGIWCSFNVLILCGRCCCMCP